MMPTLDKIGSFRLVPVGRAIERDAETIVDAWTDRVLEAVPRAEHSYREALRNLLPEFLRSLGCTLAERGPEEYRAEAKRLAAEHGTQRWQMGWQLDEMVRDYQVLRFVVLEHLAEQEGGDLELHEVLAIGVWLDEAITHAVAQFVQHRDGVRTAELRRLALEVSRAAQVERRMLAQELHDGLQQLLVAAQMQVQLCAQDPRPEALKDVADLLGQSIVATRELTFNLSPPALEEGLPAGLRWLASVFEERYGLTVHVDCRDEHDPPGENVRLLVFESVRELLFNVVKHADTEAAEIDVTRPARDRFRIVVVDRGKGFDGAEPNRDASTPGGFGLANLDRRLQLLGGSLHVESEPGAGTKAVIEVGIAEPSEDGRPA